MITLPPQRKLLIVLGAAAALVVLGLVGLLAAAGVFAGPLTPAEAEAELKALFDGALEDDAVRNASLRVTSRRHGISLALAGGVADVERGAEMTPETPFLSASIGKLFTAATVLSLVDEGALELDDPVVRHLPPERLRGLSPAPEKITLRHLLGHRSGIADYYEGETRDGAPNVLNLLAEKPEKAWTLDELLAYTADHFEPVGAPGETWRYSDTNYDLLGLVIEARTGVPFHEAVRARVLEPLELRRTWYYNHEPAPTRYADVFFGEKNLARAPALSLDGAGGGLATTSADLERALRTLVEDGRLEALTPAFTEDAVAPGIDYGLSVWRLRPPGLFPLFDEGEALGVSGSTGSFVYFAPEYDAYLSGSFNQTEYAFGHVIFLLRALAILDRIEAVPD